MIGRVVWKLGRWMNGTGRLRFCPICERSFHKFIRFGLIPREDAECPGCGALERHRLFWLYLRRVSSFYSIPPKKFLHVAPEPVFEQRFRAFLDSGSYWTADLYASGVDVQMDITDINFGDGSFDFIYCSHVLEHVPDDQKAVEELYRVLSEGGTAILMVPITTTRTFEDPTVMSPVDRRALYGQDDHVRRYGPDFQKRLEAANFRVQKIAGADFLNGAEIERYGITSDAGEIFVCTKGANQR